MATAAHDTRTFGPHEGGVTEIISFVEELHRRDLDAPQARARLVSKGDTEAIELPDELFQALMFVARQLAEGRAVCVAPLETLMTTQDAADFRGMSRPSLLKIVDRGDLACTLGGRHRRLRLGDLIEYQREQAEVRRAALDDMIDIAADDGSTRARLAQERESTNASPPASR